MGWKPEAGLGALVARDGAAPTSQCQASPSAPLFYLWRGLWWGEFTGLGGITVDSLVSTSTLHFRPPILAQTVAQPPSFHTFEAAKKPLCHPLSPTWPLSSHPPLTLRGKSRHVCCRPV